MGSEREASDAEVYGCGCAEGCGCGRVSPRKKKAKVSAARSAQWTKFLRVTIYVNLFLTVGNALLYGGVGSVTDLFMKAIQGLTSPSEVYYAKDASSRAGSLIVWITFAYSPVMYITHQCLSPL